MQVKENVIDRVVSLLKKKTRPQVNYILKLPKNRPIGKTYYTVESALDPVTFDKRKDAEAFKKLLFISNKALKADIIRREITTEGYIPTYPGDKKG